MKLVRHTLLCATMLMGMGTTQAFAQTAPAEDTATEVSDDDAIVVTATRRETSLQDAPINISAVSSEDIEKQRIDDVKGLAAFTPGLA